MEQMVKSTAAAYGCRAGTLACVHCVCHRPTANKLCVRLAELTITPGYAETKNHPAETEVVRRLATQVQAADE